MEKSNEIKEKIELMPYDEQGKIVKSKFSIREKDLEMSENDLQMFQFNFGFQKKYMDFERQNMACKPSNNRRCSVQERYGVV